jgi:hypothetical protein
MKREHPRCPRVTPSCISDSVLAGGERRVLKAVVEAGSEGQPAPGGDPRAHRPHAVDAARVLRWRQVDVERAPSCRWRISSTSEWSVAATIANFGI